MRLMGQIGHVGHYFSKPSLARVRARAKYAIMRPTCPTCLQTPLCCVDGPLRANVPGHMGAACVPASVPRGPRIL